MAESTTVTITFIRHGESTDNLLPIWAGWRDAPLSDHGLAQAKALGASLSPTHFDLILASPLKRAYTTAQSVLDAQPEPKPKILTSPLLREQTRGVAEGHPWLTEPKPGMSLEEHYAQGLFPIHHERWQKFPGGESLDDLAERAEKAVLEVILPHVLTRLKSGVRGSQIAVASHGLLIAEMIPVLLKMDPTSAEPRTSFRGMKNTAWTQVTVDFVERRRSQEDKILRVKVVEFNSHKHLDNIAFGTPSKAITDSIQTFSGSTAHAITEDSASRSESRL